MLLLAESCPSLRQVLTIFLELEGLEVRAVRHGGQVKEAMEGGERPDVLVLGFCMPVLDGPGVARYVRSRPELAHTPIVVLTRYADTSALRPGDAQGILLKPFDLYELLAVVRSLVPSVASGAAAAG